MTDSTTVNSTFLPTKVKRAKAYPPVAATIRVKTVAETETMMEFLR